MRGKGDNGLAMLLEDDADRDEGRMAFTFDLEKSAQAHHIAYQRRDPRTGKLEQIGVLGWNPQKPEREDSEGDEEARAGIVIAGEDKLNEDDLDSRVVLRYVAAKKPQTRDDVKAAIKQLVAEFSAKKQKGDAAELSDYLQKNKKVHGEFINGITEHLFNTGAIEEQEDEDEEEDHVPPWTERKALAKPALREEFPAKGTKIIVGDEEHTLTPEAEHAAYRYAKEFLVNVSGRKNQEDLRRNFEQSLRSLASLPAGDLHYDYFVRRIKKEQADEEKKRKTAKPRETPESHPHLFINQDGVPTRLLGAIPGGNFYTGKKGYGTWIPSIKEEDLTMNVSHGAAPPGWRGKTISEPDKEFYLTWTHPVSGLQGYIYPSRVQADLNKFHKAATLGSVLGEISERCFADITGKKVDPSTRAAALCVMLIDQHHFRNGNEQYAKEGTFGIASLRAGHVSIDDTRVTFTFPAKKEEPWSRTVDFAGMPSALNFIKACLKGKKATDRLWEGPDWETTSNDVNKYLAPFAKNGVRPTAKVFRTFHANRYMHTMLHRLHDLKEAYNLQAGEVKALYKGIKEGSIQETTILERKGPDGKTLREAMELQPYHGSKGDADRETAIWGILPTVATKLGHTTGACRSNYLDPVNLASFGVEHGWDERTAKEKKMRDDLAGLEEKPVEKPVETGSLSGGRRRQTTKRFEIYHKNGELLDSTDDEDEALGMLRAVPAIASVFDADHSNGRGHQYVKDPKHASFKWHTVVE